MFLLNERVIFFFTGIDFSIPQNFISRVLLFDRFDLSLIHMVEHRYFFLLEVD